MALPADCDSAGAQSAKTPGAPNGYVKTCVIPLCRDRDYESWVRLMFTRIWSSHRVRSAVCAGSVSLLLALLLKCAERKSDAQRSSGSSVLQSSSLLLWVSELLQSCWTVLSPLLTLLCAFFWLGLYVLRCGVPVRTALTLLSLCVLGEAAARSLLLLLQEEEEAEEEPLLSGCSAALLLLLCTATGALMVARLQRGISILLLVSAVRTLSLFSLHRVRSAWRPYVAYLVGVLGILLARYADRLLPSPGSRQHKEGCTPVTGAREEIPVFKRRRRSSSVIASDMAHSQPSSKSHRRTSLPCIQRDQVRSLCPVQLFFLFLF